MTSSRVHGEQAAVLNFLIARKFAYRTTSDKGRGKKKDQEDNSALDSFSKFQLPIFAAEPTSLHRFYLFKSVCRAQSKILINNCNQLLHFMNNQHCLDPCRRTRIQHTLCITAPDTIAQGLKEKLQITQKKQSSKWVMLIERLDPQHIATFTLKYQIIDN